MGKETHLKVSPKVRADCELYYNLRREKERLEERVQHLDRELEKVTIRLCGPKPTPKAPPRALNPARYRTLVSLVRALPTHGMVPQEETPQIAETRQG